MGKDEWEAVSQVEVELRYLQAEPMFQIMLIDPGQFRVINELLQKECKGRGRLETMTMSASTT
jgi:ribosome maturation protein SDO1